ncbi:metallophosphoesterase family protein, partial [Psychroserpens sp.]|uniref:metallophosphoesterase family protein n=1 Tax=Psychroserpens sp. TaxID=2020870 RepID=UPI003C77F2ED
MSIYAIGDIHGGLKGLTQLLDRMPFTQEDTLIFLGDYVDGWSESAQVIDFLIDFSKTTDCIFIKGNHDVWCEDWLRSGRGDAVWLAHGGQGTVESYVNYSAVEKKKHFYFFADMPLFHIDERDRLFVHAGFTSEKGVVYEVHKKNFYFDRTLLEMAMTAEKNISNTSMLSSNRLKHYKEIYIGHTPTINFNVDKPINVMNLWDIDTGAAFTGKLSAIDIETKKVFQSEPLLKLYPNELGRNKA